MKPKEFGIKERAKIVQQTLNGEYGKDFMNVLSFLCLEDVSVKGQDPYMTYYNIGKRDLLLQLRYLQEYIDINERERQNE